VSIVSETRTDLLCYCPFHANSDSPAFTISKQSGLYMCHNAACQGNHGGNLERLVMLKSSKNPIEALRFIANKQSESTVSLAETIKDFDVEPEHRIIPQKKIDELVDGYQNSKRAISYMESRGFIPETTSYFEVGYDRGMDMVVVPIHDLRGNVIGVNGRSVEGKRFKLSKSIERNNILFNLHRARRMGGTAIVFESQFDVMKVHQAGFPNGVCFFGSHVSRAQAGILQRYFDRVIIMTDADAAGRKSGHTLSGMLRNKRVEWAIHDWGVIYPHGAKDAGDLNEDEIRHCINNAVSDVAYKSYKQLAQPSKV
jgi:DNA primase